MRSVLSGDWVARSLSPISVLYLQAKDKQPSLTICHCLWKVERPDYFSVLKTGKSWGNQDVLVTLIEGEKMFFKNSELDPGVLSKISKNSINCQIFTGMKVNMHGFLSNIFGSKPSSTTYWLLERCDH